MSINESNQDDVLHMRTLLEARKKRLRALEVQAATYGIDVRPHVQTEIDDLRVQIRDLEQRITQYEQERPPSILRPALEKTFTDSPAARQAGWSPQYILLACVAATILLVVIALMARLLGWDSQGAVVPNTSTTPSAGLSASTVPNNPSMAPIGEQAGGVRAEHTPTLEQTSIIPTTIIAAPSRVIAIQEKPCMFEGAVTPLDTVSAEVDESDSKKEGTGEGLGSLQANKSTGTFTLTYSLPQKSDFEYAHFILTLYPPVDVSQCHSIRFKLSSDGSGICCKLFANSPGSASISISVGDGIHGEIVAGEQLVDIELSQLRNQGLNLASVEEIGFEADVDFTQGEHSFTVSQIEFLK